MSEGGGATGSVLCGSSRWGSAGLVDRSACTCGRTGAATWVVRAGWCSPGLGRGPGHRGGGLGRRDGARYDCERLARRSGGDFALRSPSPGWLPASRPAVSLPRRLAPPESRSVSWRRKRRLRPRPRTKRRQGRTRGALNSWMAFSGKPFEQEPCPQRRPRCGSISHVLAESAEWVRISTTLGDPPRRQRVSCGGVTSPRPVWLPGRHRLLPDPGWCYNRPGRTGPRS